MRGNSVEVILMVTINCHFTYYFTRYFNCHY